MSRLWKPPLQISEPPQPPTPAHGAAQAHAATFRALVASLSALLAILVMCVCYFCKRFRVVSRKDGGTRQPNHRKLAEQWPNRKLETATQNFSERRILGTGRYARVYKGILPDGTLVAVKRFTAPAVTAPGAAAAIAFGEHMRLLSRAHHPHVVPIVGYSTDDGPTCVMQMMTRGTLHQLLHGEKGFLLEWTRRVRFAAEIACGLAYLHAGTIPPIVHGNIEPSNVLIDATWSARISDYGLAFLGAHPSEGYADKEFYESGSLGKGSDVFGLGVVVLEMLSGRRPPTVPEWAVSTAQTEAGALAVLDPRLPRPWNVEPLLRAVRVACLCVQGLRRQRPSIFTVAQLLTDVDRDFNGEY